MDLIEKCLLLHTDGFLSNDKKVTEGINASPGAFTKRSQDVQIDRVGKNRK